ncbi:MAG: hypothetical protein JXA60_07165 [Candidatus Coatesbacteria bacterium]|nr:hypothetical protein [Candidatus Coatesbacteria bacterium]
MLRNQILFFSLISFLFSACSCSKNPKQKSAVTIKQFALDDLSEVITKDNVEIDKNDSFDKKGSLKISTDKDIVIKLFDIDENVEDAKIVFSAKMKSKDLEGNSYLEMWVMTPDKKEFFSRGLDNAIKGNNNWGEYAIPFFLKKGEKITHIRLNLVIKGKGTVWIDDVKVEKVRN